MPDSAVIYTKEGHVAYITLNRAEAGNRINQEVAHALEGVCAQVRQDDGIYVVLLTGAGEQAFCSGSELTPEQFSPSSAIAGIDRPVLVAINGEALGEGLALALCGDIRIASNKARFGFPEVTRGLIPGEGGTQRLPRIVGKGKALELILTGETIDAETAQSIGLVSKVVPGEKLAAEAETMAQNLASKGPIALRFIKEAVNKGLDLTLEQGLRLEADLYFLLHTTSDRTEGIRTFLEKRPSQFKGQ